MAQDQLGHWLIASGSSHMERGSFKSSIVSKKTRGFCVWVRVVAQQSLGDFSVSIRGSKMQRCGTVFSPGIHLCPVSKQNVHDTAKSLCRSNMQGSVAPIIDGGHAGFS